MDEVKALEKFIWSEDRYSVGDQELDQQHRGVLELINRIIDQVHAGEDDQMVLVGALMEMNDYASSHFQSEEALLKRLGYPLLDHQHHSHDYYTERVSGFVLDLEHRKVTLEEVLEFIKVWWDQHILVEDMGFKDFLQQSASKG